MKENKVMPRQSFTIFHTQTCAQPVLKLGMVHVPRHPPLLSYCWEWHCMAQTMPLVSLALMCTVVFPSNLSCTSNLLTRGESEKQRRSCWHRSNAAQPQLKHQCVISVVLVTNLRQSSLWAAMKKINSIPARHSRVRQVSLLKSGFLLSCGVHET